jgi:acyl-CoA synthetase (AMP-forming)/AMP-acid ligase II/predicted NAD/FAD-dependent oxidoreductase/acyl carrier protein
MVHPETLIEKLRRRAQETPHEALYTFVDDAGRDAETLTWSDLLVAAGTVAGHLAAGGLAAGDRAVLVYAPSLDFVRAFVGCLIARVVPVPVAPPNPYNLEHELPALATIVRSARASAILTDSTFAGLQELAGAQPELAERPWTTTSGLAPLPAPSLPLPGPGDVAFVQYTSGSTSAPRGVLLTHGNLEHQLAANARELDLGPDARSVVWVPHFHDFGLVSGILSALHGNGRLWLMSPLTFVQRPHLWFDVMARVRATHTAAPNFAFDLALRKTTPEQRRAWDLSALRVVMSAAEPIRSGTVRGFLDAFAAARLDPRAFCPAYGLAEHTVGVSVRGRVRARFDRDALEREGRAVPVSDGVEHIGCGRPPAGVRVRIVDLDTGAPRPEGSVGEIWVSSPSKAAGYDGLPEETRAVFEATIPGDDALYLRTGDLGFLHEGEIFVVGRAKDTIIARGRNLHPEDVEESLRGAHDLLRPGGVAAFGLAGPAEVGDQLVVLAELRAPTRDAAALDAVVAAVRAAVLRDHRQAVAVVVLVKPGAILKTSSGKLRRRAMRQAYERGELRALRVARDLAPRTLADTVAGFDDGLRELAGGVARWFAGAARERRGRVFHKTATTLGGSLEAAPADGLPPHPLFAPGKRYPVLVRHANGVQEDDAAWDNRGATLRVLDPAREGALDAPVLDLLLTTGRAFLAPTALAFARWMRSTRAERDAIAAAEPHLAAAAWEMFRAPASYTEVHYGSKTASELLAEDGRRVWARFRLRRPDLPADGAFVQGDTLLPPDLIPRRPDDARSPTFLHEELRARVEDGGVDYVLEMQVHAPDEAALDCTRPWPEETHPWRVAARLHLDRVVDPGAIERLHFSSRNAPPDLAPPPARSATEPASLEQLRQVVYEIAACARLGEPLPPALAALVADPARPAAAAATPRPSGGLRVCVIGAGASGLTAAWNLERLGHRVTVLDAAQEVAGKCASIEIDGRSHDLGGHLCTPQYRAFARLVSAVGGTIEEATPTYTYDLDERRVVPWDESAPLREAFLRYRALRERDLADLDRPGFAGVGKRLARPTAEWLGQHDLAPLGDAIGGSYTSTGYGYLRDPDIPALYFVRAAETAGLLAKGGDRALPPYWTVQGGMGGLWRRVAASLADVRLGVRVGAVERRGDRVRVAVTASGRRERLEFDRLVLAVPLDDALRFLDASLEERELFERVRYLDYYTVVARVTGLPEKGFYILQQNTGDPARIGRPVAFHHRYAGSDVISFYAYGDAATGEREVERLVREDVARLGGRVESVAHVRRWKYFPHVGPEDVEAGFYDRIEALQGENGTFYCGSLLNFELIECNVRYAEALVDRHFGDGLARAEAAAHPGRPARSPGEIVAWLVAAVAAETKHDPGAVVPDAPIDHLGLDSLGVTALVTRLSDWLGWAVPTATIYERRTLAGIADALARADAERERSEPAVAVAAIRVPAGATPEPRPRVRITGPRDLGAVRAYWRDHFGVGRWPFEDLLFGCIERFVKGVVFEDEAAFERVRGRGCVYLANHQVASEPALLSTIMAGLTGKRVVGLAKIEGRDSDLGWFMEHMFSYPGVTHPRTYVYLDRSKPEELGLRVSELSASLGAGESNVLIHVQGTRGTTCREPVRLFNPMFIEMAIAAGAPIVPVRFASGLPVEPLVEKLDFPVGFTRQEYRIGRPILPEELSSLGFGARAERVLAAMNGLGPSNEVEEPGPPDPAFGAAVSAWVARTGAVPLFAVLMSVLAELGDPCEGARRILEGARAGGLVVADTPVDRWLAALARRLYGPRGPEILRA